MEVLLLFLVALLFTVSRCNSRAPHAPARAAARSYTEKASAEEMMLGTRCMNIGGSLFLVVGAGLSLRACLADSSSGLFPTIAGTAAGILLVVLGDSAYRRGLQSFAEGLVACGLCTLLLTQSAAHFYFHLMDRAALFVSVVLIVAASGLSVFRHDSRLVGQFMLATLYLGPLLLDFRLDTPASAIAYLVAIHAGIAGVAWCKKWDWFLLISFPATFCLFFYSAGTRHPAAALTFMTVVYLLYLVSNNALHFSRRGRTGCSLALSFVNPLVYGVVSYVFLAAMSDVIAIGLYLGLAVIHLVIAACARERVERNVSLVDLALHNLALGILFLTAAVSFVTYLSDDTTYFSVVTALWFAEAFVLLDLSQSPRAGLFAGLLRGFSLMCLTLCAAQLAVVIPAIHDGTLHRLLVDAGSAAAFIIYFCRLRARTPDPEGAPLLTLRFCATAALALGAVMLAEVPDLPLFAVGLACLTLVALELSIREPQVLRFFEIFAALGAAVSTAVLLSLGLVWPVFLACLAAAGACSICALRLQGRIRPVSVMAGAATALLYKASLCLSTGVPATMLWALIALALLLAVRMRPRDEAHQQAVRGLFFLVFFKSVLFDGNFVYVNGEVALAPFQSMAAGHFLAVLVLVCVFFAAARAAAHCVEARNTFTVLGLIVSAFQSACILYDVYGVLDQFQIILSAFWGCAAFGCIFYGIEREIKVFRLFGLVLLVSTVAKICLVDVWVLNAYSQTTTFVIVGFMLLSVSFLYQTHRATLADEGPLAEGG